MKRADSVQAVSAMTVLRVPGLLIVGVVLALVAAACSDPIPEQSDVPVTMVTPSATLFRDATESSGLMYVQHEAREPGNCLFDNMSRETEEEQRGMLCDAERMTGGAAAGDFDGDGAIDLIVTRLDGHDLLYRNRGDGRFDEVSAEVGLSDWNLASNGALWGDIDNDGDLDLFITTVGDTRHYLFINQGGEFTEEAMERGTAVETGDRRIGFSAAFGDYDRDGYLDLHVTEWRPSQLVGEARAGVRLLRNRGADAPGYFEDVTESAGVAMEQVVSQTQQDLTVGTFAFGSTFVDLDGDGWPELAVSSDFGTSRLFWNNGDGTFTDGTLDARVGTAQNAMGTTFGDYDADGDLDWFVTSVYSSSRGSPGGDEEGTKDGNRLFRNDGDRRFSDVTDLAGVRNGSWGWGRRLLRCRQRRRPRSDHDQRHVDDAWIWRRRDALLGEPGHRGRSAAEAPRLAWTTSRTARACWSSMPTETAIWMCLLSITRRSRASTSISHAVREAGCGSRWKARSAIDRDSAPGYPSMRLVCLSRFGRWVCPVISSVRAKVRCISGCPTLTLPI